MLQTLLLLFILTIVSCKETERPPVTVTRTEIKVSRSLHPEDMQTLNVMTRDGSVAQLIVKRRDPKTKPNLQTTELEKGVGEKFTKSFYTNWIPVSSVYLQPNIIRLDTIALVRNSTDNKKVSNNLGNVIDSDRYVRFYLFLVSVFI